MDASPWHIDGHFARLRLAGLSAAVDQTHFGDGLASLEVAGHAWSGTRLLGVGQQVSGIEQWFVDWHVRGYDLVAAYEEPGARAKRIDLLWHVATPQPTDEFLVGIDLIVSLRTEHSLVHPWEPVVSELANCEPLRLTADNVADVASIDLSSAPKPINFETGCGCYVFRATSLPWVYVQMVHPADRRLDTVFAGRCDKPLALVHFLFDEQNLEKGVIYRARLRGLFFPPDVTAETIARHYAAFTAADPPLGT